MKQFVCSIVFILCSIRSNATPLRITTVDVTGAAFPNVLVIVRSLGDRAEVFRALSNDKGAVEAHDLKSGPYQIIATCPYGICKTSIEEVVVDADQSLNVRMIIPVITPKGDVISIGHHDYQIVKAVGTDGKPLSGVDVLIRDPTASWEKWYKTDVDGKVDVEIPREFKEFTLVALYHGELITKDIVEPKNADEVVLRF